MAVGRDPVPRPYHEPVADLEALDRHLVAVLETRRLGAELEQRPERVARPPSGPGLEEASEQQQRDDHRCRLEVHVRGVATTERATHRHPALGGAQEHERDHRPRVRGQRAQRHEGVHRGGAVAQVDQRRLVERPAGPEDHWCREHERHPLPLAELQRRDHRDQQHRDRKSNRHVQPRA